jgi:hypothetical protein
MPPNIIAWIAMTTSLPYGHKVLYDEEGILENPKNEWFTRSNFIIIYMTCRDRFTSLQK